MGMWSGIRQGIKEDEASKLSEEKMELARRQEERLEEQFSLTKTQALIDQSIAIKNSLGSGADSIALPGVGSKSTSGSGKNNLSTKAMTAVLVETYQLDSDVLESIYQQGGTKAGGRDNILRAYNIAKKYNDKWNTGKYTGEVPSVVLGNMLTNAVRSEGSTVTIDWDSVETNMGTTISDEVRRNVGDTYDIPGQTVFETPGLVETPAWGDIKTVKQLAIEDTIEASRMESVKITNVLASMQEQNENVILGSPEAKVRAWLVDRQAAIKAAQKSADDKIYSPIIQMYGAGVMLDTLKTFDKSMQNAPFGSAFSEASQEPTDVGDEITYGLLKVSGFLKNGQPVTYMKTGPDGIDVRITENVGD